MKLIAPIINDEDVVNKEYVDTAADKLQSQVNNKADKEHNHDNRYYTESEVDSKVSGINKTISDHISNTSNPHDVTKSQVGLGNVENKSSATIRGEITKSNITTALGYTPLNQSLKGSANGLAELDSNGKVPSSQLPSFVDDVVEGYLSGGKFYKESAHTTEISGETGKIYIDLSTEKTYRWSGSAFVVISETLALGETSSTAYRGDRGKIAYDHSQSTHARTDATNTAKSNTNGNIKINGTETNVYTLPTASSTLGGVKTTSTVTSNSGYTAVPIIDGVPYYKDTNTDTKVTQTNTTTSADYRIALSYNSNDTTETQTLRKSTNFLANPSTGEFYAKGYRRIDISGQTLDINTLNLSSGSPMIMYYIEKTSGGSSNITNIPVKGNPFLLDVELIRWASTSDYITRQTFRNAANPANEYVRFCTNGAWGSWITRVFTDTNTDTKVTSVYKNPSSSDTQTTFYPTWVTGATTGGVLINDGIRYSTIQGTTSAEGYSILSLGNNTASGTAENKYGAIRLYSTDSYYGQIAQIPGGSDNAKHALPTASGTILNTGTTSFTQSLTSGTAIGTLKINNKSTTLYAPTNTDTKVTSVGNHYTPSADSSAALSASASDATAAWSIDVVKGVTLQRDAKGHVTGVSVTSGKIPANPNTDTKVTQTVTTSNASYPLLLAPNGQTATATTTAYFDSGVTLNPSTNTIAANISGNANTATIAKKVNNSLTINGESFDGSAKKNIDLLPFIIGTQTAATGTWTGNAPTISALSDGLTIRYWLPYAGSGNATLNLTLADGTDTGNIYCYYGGTSRLSTHYGAGNIITLTYRENITIAGSKDTYTGWWADANYNVSNTAGSTNTTSKIFLIGATSQKTATTTYSRNNIYANSDNCLYLDNNSKANSYFISKQTYTDSNNKNVNHQIQFGISSSGNRGIYDSDMKWLIYANTSNKVIVNGDIVTGAISETSSSWTGTGGYTFNYVTGRNRALILAWMDYTSTYTSFACISINSSTTISSTLLLEPSSTTGLYYSVSKGNISISGGAGGASYKCTVLWFTV